MHRHGPVLMANQIVCGKAEKLIPRLRDRSIALVVTSPPYANQRSKFYPSIHERDYPEWITGIMRLLMPKMRDDGSVIIDIRPHIKKGEISDYVLWSRLAIREAGWIECEELIWRKMDAPPLGSNRRPRRTYEHLLWFSPGRNPFTDLWACGNKSETATGNKMYCGGRRKKTGTGYGNSALARTIHDGQTIRRSFQKARVTDVIEAHVGGIAAGIEHPAMFPRKLPNILIQTFSRPNDLVLDPFNGSGTTTLEAAALGRRWVGLDAVPTYARMARRRHIAATPIAD